MRIRSAALLAIVVATWSVTAVAQEDAGRAWVQGLREIWQQEATADDLEALVELLAPDAVYEHPPVGMQIEGREAIRQAMSGFLGASRHPEISALRIETARGVAVVAFDLRMEVRAEGAWESVYRQQIIVLNLTENGISRVSDYW